MDKIPQIPVPTGEEIKTIFKNIEIEWGRILENFSKDQSDQDRLNFVLDLIKTTFILIERSTARRN